MKGPISEDDLEWAQLHREQAERSLEPALREFSGRWARDGYLESSGGDYEGNGAPWEEVDKDARKPWEAFGTRIRKAPAPCLQSLGALLAFSRRISHGPSGDGLSATKYVAAVAACGVRFIQTLAWSGVSVEPAVSARIFW